MKRIAYSFLLIFLLSCGSSSHLQGNRVRIQFRDSMYQDFELLAVRDSSLIVQPYAEKNIPELIPFSQIDRVYHDADGKILGGIYGCGVGGVALGSAAAIAIQGEYSGLAVVAAIAIGGIFGMPVGCAIAKDDAGYDPYDHLDLLSIKYYSTYRYGEPPELQKIK